MKEITSYELRIIAFCTMFIDHMAACVLLPMINAGIVSPVYTPVYLLMRYIGRLAFPIFAFFLAQGMIYSRSREKYMLRLFLLAIVSEPVYDYVCRSGIWDIKYQNVIWELLLGAIVIYSYQKLGIVTDPLTGRKESVCPRMGRGICITIAIAITGVDVIIASLIRADYAITGILLIMCLYLFRNKKSVCVVIGAFILFAGTFADKLIQTFGTANALSGALNSAITELIGAFPLLLILRYSGVKGKNMPRWLSYGFYPLHLLLLAVIRALLMM